MERWTLPEGWEWVRIGDLVTVNYGDGLPQRARLGGSVPVYGANGIVGYHNTAITRGQTIIIGRKGSAGAVNWSNVPCWPIDTTFFIDEFPESIFPKFLYYFLQNRELEKLQQFAAIPGLNRNILCDVPIPLPSPSDPARSLAEQRRIVARLEALLGEVRELRALQAAIEADVGRLMEAALGEVFPSQEQALPEGWEWKTLPEICRINPQRPRIQRDDDTPTSFVPMQAVDDQTGTIVDMQIRPYGEVRRGYTYFEENDVLMAKITPSMENGKAAIARGLIDCIGFGTTEFHVFHPFENILPEWIFFFIRRKAFRERAKMSFRGAVGQQRVPEDFLVAQEIPIPYPSDPPRSLAEQRRIVAYLDAVQAEVNAARRLAAHDRQALAQLEQSILAAAFRGEM